MITNIVYKIIVCINIIENLNDLAFEKKYNHIIKFLNEQHD